MPLVIQLDKLAFIILIQFRLKYQSTSAVVNITFRQAKAFLYFLLKIKALFFQVRAIRGETRAEKLLINRQQKLANPINALTSLTFSGSCQFIIALIFFRSIYIPSIEIRSLRYRTSILQNSHLSISNCRLAPYRAYIIRLTYFWYLVRLLLYIKILSI